MKPPVALWEGKWCTSNCCSCSLISTPEAGMRQIIALVLFAMTMTKKKSHIINMWLPVGSRCPHLCQQPYSSAMSPNPTGVPKRAASRPGKDAPTYKAPNLSTFLAGCGCRMAAIRSHKAGSERCRVHRHKTRARPSFPRGFGVSQTVFVCGYRSVSICPGYSASKQISSA